MNELKCLLCSEPLVAHPSLAWCLERKIPSGRRLFSQAGRKRNGFMGYREQSLPPYSPQGLNRPRPRTHLHQMHRSGNVKPMKGKASKSKNKIWIFQHGSERCEPEQQLVPRGGMRMDAAKTACLTANQAWCLIEVVSWRPHDIGDN